MWAEGNSWETEGGVEAQEEGGVGVGERDSMGDRGGGVHVET